MLNVLLRAIGGACSPHALNRIASPADWRRLAARLDHSTVSRTETVKFVVDLDDAGATHFLDTRRWPSHYSYVAHHIDARADYQRFNATQYADGPRRYLLGSVTHYLDGDHWTVELDPSDRLDGEWIAWLFSHVAARARVARDLRFRPASLAQEQAVAAARIPPPMLSRDAINREVKYQPVVQGSACGYLRVHRGNPHTNSMRPYDIVVTDVVPLEIPPVAAIVTGQLQAPLAHVAVLSRNRNTPDMALRGATSDPALLALEGRLVRLTVTSQDFQVAPVSPEEAEAAWAAARPAAPYVPPRDTTALALHDLDALSVDAVRWAGAKAVQCARLRTVDRVHAPAGFVIPFAWYASHIESAGIPQGMALLSSDPSLRTDAAARAVALARLREAILSQPVDAELVNAVQARLGAMSHTGRFIFRSSTNAEDLPGFNGAGLYESVVIEAAPNAARIADALREVWASVWLLRAHEEREWYRIDHSAVAMAVLVQPVVDAIATGVAITGNPFRRDLPGVFINLQARSSSVTGAGGDELPEQHLITKWEEGYACELLGRSSLCAGELMMTGAQIEELATALIGVHEAMLPPDLLSANAMDVEFAVTADRQFIMLQARPYMIVHPPRPEPCEPSALQKATQRWRRLLARFEPGKPRRRVGPTAQTSHSNGLQRAGVGEPTC